jgi:hypothetical protein
VSKIGVCAIWLLTSGILTGCQHAGSQPLDAHIRTIDPREDLRNSDVVVLAEPISERRSPIGSQVSTDGSAPIELQEVDLTINVLFALKGGSLTGEIRFVYYDSPQTPQIGAPRGASGGKGSMGIFFLTRQSDQTLRSAVDVYRPDISTPWLIGKPESPRCGSPSECLATLLLTFHAGDDASSFAHHLIESAATVRQAVGPNETIRLLRNLATSATPNVVRQRACSELASGYPLQFPPDCSLFLTDTARNELVSRSARMRDELNRRGVPWIRQMIGITDDVEVKRYLESLLQSPDAATQSLGRRLLEELR